MEGLARRPADEFGGNPSERQFIARLHATQEDVPTAAIRIDATLPVYRVARRCFPSAASVAPTRLTRMIVIRDPF